MNATAKTDNKPKAAIETNIEKMDGELSVALPLGRLMLDFANGQGLSVEINKLTPEMLFCAVMHGLKQKFVDAAAISRDPETGRPATIDTKFAAVEEVVNRVLGGDWNKRREGGGSTGGLLYRALVRMYEGKRTPEELKSWLDKKDDKEKAALRKNAAVAKIIDELRAEAGDENAADDLLAELDSDAEE